jgi:integrase
MYIRTVNSYLTWLHDEGHIPNVLRVKLLRASQPQHTLLSPADIKALLLFKPNGLSQRRTRTLILLLLDTGIRISEALTLERQKLNLDDMLITVWGISLQSDFTHKVIDHAEKYASDASRFALALKGIIGKRLTYAALTGAELPSTC